VGVSAKFVGTCTVVSVPVQGTLVEAKCAHLPLNVRILTTSVLFTLTAVQVPNLALVETIRITVCRL
jgi:hypothetical protein